MASDQKAIFYPVVEPVEDKHRCRSRAGARMVKKAACNSRIKAVTKDKFFADELTKGGGVSYNLPPFFSIWLTVFE